MMNNVTKKVLAIFSNQPERPIIILIVQQNHFQICS